MKVPVFAPKKSSQKAAKRIKDKYARIIQNKAKSKKFIESNKRNKILKEIDTVEEIRDASDKKRTRITADKILKKYKNMKIPKKTYLVNEEDIETIYYTEPKEDLFADESIVNASNKVLNFKQFKKEQEKELKKGKKGKKVAAKNILKKYKNLKKPKKTYLVNEEDLETINYDEPQEDLFEGESILAAANKVLDFDKFKQEQEKELKKGKKGKQVAAKNILKKYKNLKKPKKTYLVNKEDLETINYDEPQEDLFEGKSILAAANKMLDFEKKLQQCNDQLMNDAETVKYVDDLNLEDIRDIKNLKITVKKISDKYRKLRKRKATVSVPKLHKITETFVPADKKGKRQRGKAALIAAKNISKK